MAISANTPLVTDTTLENLLTNIFRSEIKATVAMSAAILIVSYAVRNFTVIISLIEWLIAFETSMIFFSLTAQYFILEAHIIDHTEACLAIFTNLCGSLSIVFHTMFDSFFTFSII